MADETVVVQTEQVPLDGATMSEFKAARAKGEEVATRETVVEEKPEKQAADEKPRAKGGFQARIDRLIKQQAALEEAKTAAEKKAADLEAKLNGNTAPKTEQTDGEPQRDKFASEAEYIRALTRWEVKQEIKAEREASEKQAVEAQIKEARSNYNARMIALQAENEEYKELMQQSITVPAAIEGPITLEMENGPEVAIFLAQNPDVCKELIEMSASRAVAEVWKISEKLAAGETQETEEETAEREKAEAAEAEKEKAEAAKVKPRPIRPVSSGTSRSTIPLDKADYQAYKKLRAQGRVQ